MLSSEGLRAEFGAALVGVEPGLASADRLCHACVDLLEVEGAAISLVRGGSTQGTFGSSSPLSRRLDEYQFTFGEGPCLDSVRSAHPIHVGDLRDPAEQRWPAYAGAVLGEGVRAVSALPVSIGGDYVGALDLFRTDPVALSGSDLTGGLLAAQLAALPLLDLMGADADWAAIGQGDPWAELASLERVEVYQATGMIIGRLGVGPAEALLRLRAHAFAHGMTASEVAWKIVGRELTLEADEPLADREGTTGAPNERGPGTRHLRGVLDAREQLRHRFRHRGVLQLADRRLRTAARHRCGGAAPGRRPGHVAPDGGLLRTHARGGELPAPARGGPVSGLLPRRVTGVGGRSRRGGVPVAAVRAGGNRGGVRLRACPSDAPARKSPGALGLFGTRVGALGDDDLELGQALADVASLALVADKASADKIDISGQLQTALHGRIAVEQAKGVLAELGGLDMEQAFVALRRYARDHRCSLTDVAARTVSRELSADQILEHAETPSS